MSGISWHFFISWFATLTLLGPAGTGIRLDQLRREQLHTVDQHQLVFPQEL